MPNEKSLILVVDDNPYNLQVFAEFIESHGYECAMALNGHQALEFIEREKPDLILLDVMMPELDGYEVCSKVKENDACKDIPIIFLTARSETDDVVKGFESGAVDYVAKPFKPVELNARMKTHLELKKSREELKEFNAELIKANEIIIQKNLQLKEAMDKLEHAAKTDVLTEIYNRRYMIEKIEEEVVRYKRNDRQFSIVICDIDHFKQFNDKYGHDCGDFVLKSLSQVMLSLIREQDSLARWGGEEFLLLLPETDNEGAGILAERIRNEIASTVYQYNGNDLSITMTFGIAAYGNDEGIDASIKRADTALLEGKSKGRNCIVVG